MTSLLERDQPSPHAPTGRSERSRLPVPARNRKPVLVLVSLVMVFSSIAVFADIYASANRQTSVLIVTQPIQQGQKLSGTDLGEASVSISSGVSPIPVTDAKDLVGQRAAVTIPAGSLLTAGDLTDSQPIVAGDAVVGMALKPGQLPASGVESGDEVMIVQTASLGAPLDSPASTGGISGGVRAITGVLVPEALVFDVEGPPADSASSVSQLVSVEVSSTLAAAVSTAAAADQVSLVLLPSALAGLDPSALATVRPAGMVLLAASAHDDRWFCLGKGRPGGDHPRESRRSDVAGTAQSGGGRRRSERRRSRGHDFSFHPGTDGRRSLPPFAVRAQASPSNPISSSSPVGLMFWLGPEGSRAMRPCGRYMRFSPVWMPLRMELGMSWSIWAGSFQVDRQGGWNMQTPW